MKRIPMSLVALAVCLLTPLLLTAQQPKPGVLSEAQVKKLVPSVYYFSGQSATVQLRNSAGFATAEGKYVLAGLVDTSGYSTDIAAKYQGFLITEVKLDVGGTELDPGEYGFGFSKAGKFLVMDVGAHDLFRAPAQLDEKLARPVPLKMVGEGGAYRLYAGRQWVSFKVK
jgi:hypothetical protein